MSGHVTAILERPGVKLLPAPGDDTLLQLQQPEAPAEEPSPIAPQSDVKIHHMHTTDRVLEPEQTIAIAALATPRLRLRSPLVTTVRREDGMTILWHEAFDTWGSGPHLTAAIRDLQVTVADLYDALRIDQDRLGPGLARVWASMREAIIDTEIQP